MINPDFHMTIYISEEVIGLFCKTIAFAFMCWAVTKIIGMLAKHDSESKNNDA